MDRYPNFEALSRHEKEERDYKIHLRRGSSRFAVIAPHGGRIERGTMQIADAIAGGEHTFYCFEGIKENGNWTLHITSNHFDEPRAIAVARRAEKVITIHGAKGREEAVYAGGLDLDLRQHMLRALIDAGFLAVDDLSPTRQGKGQANICNCCASGKGLQLELTAALRRRMFEGPDPGGRWFPTEVFDRFVAAIRQVLVRY